MNHSSSLRHLHRKNSEVAPAELFFDLVYVFAIIQLSHLLIDHLDLTGAAETVVVFAAVWWGWNYTAWVMNWLDTTRTGVQLLTGVLMLAAFGMAIAIPSAFADGAWLFVACYLFMGVLRPVVMVVVYRGEQLAHNYRMLLCWTLGAGLFWVLGAFLEPDLRLAVWAVAVLVDYLGPSAGFRVPGLGSAPMHLWDTDAEHLAERNRLVFIIALGESILLMGGSIVGAEEVSATTAASVAIGFAALFVLWWNYFAVAGHGVSGAYGTTAALRFAFAYAHAFMVLGAIVFAVSIELRLSHEHLTVGAVVVTVAGPLIYLAGNMIFMRSRFGRPVRSRLVAMGVLVAIGAAALLLLDHLPTLALSIAVLAVMATLAALTARAARRVARSETTRLDQG